MTATMDVDSDDDDEIIAERGTNAYIVLYSYFFTTRARVYSELERTLRIISDGFVRKASSSVCLLDFFFW